MRRRAGTASAKRRANASRAADSARPARRNPSKPVRPDGRPDLQAYFDRLPQPRRGIAEALRRVVLAAEPGLVESIMWGKPWYGKGPGLAATVCYISAHTGHVNLGFPRGTSLTDPDGVLEGTGKGMRHVKVRDEADVRPALFTRWVREAARLVRPVSGRGKAAAGE